MPHRFPSQFETCILFVDTTCGTPPILPNTLRLSNGFNNASVTLYSCNSGFSSNGEDPTIFCNGTHWSITQFNCLGNTCTFKKFTLYSLFMLSYKCIQCTMDYALYSFEKKIIIQNLKKKLWRGFRFTLPIFLIIYFET